MHKQATIAFCFKLPITWDKKANFLLPLDILNLHP